MPFKSIIGSILLTAAFATPVLAAEFYIVREQGSKECRVVGSRPTVTTTTVIGDKVYVTEEEARGAVKTVCVDR